MLTIINAWRVAFDVLHDFENDNTIDGINSHERSVASTIQSKIGGYVVYGFVRDENNKKYLHTWVKFGEYDIDPLAVVYIKGPHQHEFIGMAGDD